jgi:uncharacterized protein YkwD
VRSRRVKFSGSDVEKITRRYGENGKEAATRMRKLGSLRIVLGSVFAILTLLFVVHGGATRAEALTNCNVTDATFDSEEQAFLDLINQYRATNGLTPLTVSVNLNRAATWMAQDLATKNYFSHTDSLGRDTQNRIAQCDGTAASGENLAAGTRLETAQSAFNVWRSSYGHDQNMRYADYTQIGIARFYNPGSRYKWYWATTFGVPDDGTRVTASVSLVSPQPSTKLASTTVTFQWGNSAGIDEYKLDIGTTPGGTDVYSGSEGLAHSVTVGNLPWQNRSVYVRLWTRAANIWQFADYVYTGADWWQ